MFWKKKKNNENWLLAWTNLGIEVNGLKSEVKQLSLDFEVLRNFVKDKIKKTRGDSQEPTAGDLEELRQMFGGSLPIELLEKYKNQQ